MQLPWPVEVDLRQSLPLAENPNYSHFTASSNKNYARVLLLFLPSCDHAVFFLVVKALSKCESVYLCPGGTMYLSQTSTYMISCKSYHEGTAHELKTLASSTNISNNTLQWSSGVGGDTVRDPTRWRETVRKSGENTENVLDSEHT